MERDDSLGSGSGRKRGGYARPVFPYIAPDDEKGKKAAWAVAWTTLAMGAVMMVLYVVLPP